MKRKTQSVTRLDYCQFLLGSQTNYTITHFAEHSEQFSYDAINRYLAGGRVSPRLVWENVRELSPRNKPTSCLTIRYWTSNIRQRVFEHEGKEVKRVGIKGTGIRGQTGNRE